MTTSSSAPCATVPYRAAVTCRHGVTSLLTGLTLLISPTGPTGTRADTTARRTVALARRVVARPTPKGHRSTMTAIAGARPPSRARIMARFRVVATTVMASGIL